MHDTPSTDADGMSAGVESAFADGPLGQAALHAVTGGGRHPLMALIEQLRAEDDEAVSKSEHLERALDTNRTIAAAVGIIMTRRALTYEQAFGLLRSTSQRFNRKVRDLADSVLYTGDLPTEDTDGTRQTPR